MDLEYFCCFHIVNLTYNLVKTKPIWTKLGLIERGTLYVYIFLGEILKFVLFS